MSLNIFLYTTWLLIHINSITQYSLGNIASGVNNFVKKASSLVSALSVHLLIF